MLHEFLGSLSAAFHAEAYHAAGAVGHVLLCNVIVLVAGQPGVIHELYLLVLAQELCNRKPVLAVALNAYMQALKSQVENERVHRRLNGTEIPHHLRGRLCDECAAHAELLGICYAVVALVRGAQSGELVCILHPVEMAAVNDAAAHSSAVTVHVLGRGMSYDISAPLKRTAVDRRCKRIINDKGNSVLVRGLRELLNVENSQRGVGDSLTENSLCVWLECRVEFLGGAVGADECEINTHLAHSHVEQVESTTVNGT